VPFCTQCGRKNPDDARFCAACGTPLEAAALDVREVRKTVTVVFCDVAESTSLGERLDAESLRRVMGRYFDVVSGALERHGGTVEKFIGDAVMAVFGIPVLHEDDAVRAVRAATDTLAGLRELNRELNREWGVSIQVRIGVNTGEVVTSNASGGQKLVTGDAVNVAARLEQAAGAGEVLIGRDTLRLVRDAVEAEALPPLALRGKREPVEAYRLNEVRPERLGPTRRLDSPLVGRVHERRLLQEAYARTVRERACHLFTILGAPGVGKSRLVGEFVVTLDEGATILRGRCLSYGEGITFWPLAEALREATGADYTSPAEAEERLLALLEDEDDAERIVDRVTQLAGLKPAASPPEDTFWAVRKLFEALAHRRPLVVVFDDLHWGEPSFLGLLENLSDWSRDAPIFLLCASRPELLDARPTWGGGKLNTTSVLLEPLNEDECERLILNLLGTHEYPEAVRRWVTDAAEGIPLFAEELVTMLVDEGMLERHGSVWQTSSGLGAVRVPPTINTLLASRVERLDEEDRLVLERASIEGKSFHLGAVRALTPEAAREGVGGRLLGLVRKDFVRLDRPAFPDDDAFRFRTMLIRDAVYRRMAKETRSELHEAFAAWLERTAADRLTEFEAIVGYHLEKAFRYQQEIGLIDADEADLGRGAAERLGAAGTRALARGDMPGAANLLGRAVALRDDVAAEVDVELLLLHAEALRASGELAAAKAALVRALEAAAEAGDRRLEAHAVVDGLLLETLIDPDFETDRLREAAQESIVVLEELGDDSGLAKAWRGVAEVEGTACRWGPAAEALERSLVHASRAGEEREQTLTRTHLANALYWGPTPVQEGIRRCREILEEAGGHRTVEANVLCYLAGFNAMLGNADEAWVLVGRGRQLFEEIGHTYGLAAHALLSSSVGLLSGDPQAAVRELEPSFQRLDEMGEKAILCSVAAFLAEAHLRLGHDEDAERLAQASRDAAVEDDVAPQVGWRTTLAKVLVRRRELDRAQTLAREALALAEPTDFLNLQGETLLALAEVYRAADRAGDAAEAVQQAAERFERKGNVVSARHARVLLGELQPA
jgi:class 3 adenylate cyclase/tetratricopeptide (TPR) repeat protein